MHALPACTAGNVLRAHPINLVTDRSELPLDKFVARIAIVLLLHHLRHPCTIVERGLRASVLSTHI